MSLSGSKGSQKTRRSSIDDRILVITSYYMQKLGLGSWLNSKRTKDRAGPGFDKQVEGAAEPLPTYQRALIAGTPGWNILLLKADLIL